VEKGRGREEKKRKGDGNPDTPIPSCPGHRKEREEEKRKVPAEPVPYLL